MSMTFARLVDPCFEDEDDPFRHYDYRGEPLEDRFYLPCRIDPHKDVCHAAFVHPLPHRASYRNAAFREDHAGQLTSVDNMDEKKLSLVFISLLKELLLTL